MENKTNVKKKILINLALVLVVIIGICLILTNKVKSMTDLQLANDASGNPQGFLSGDYRNTGQLQLGSGTIYVSTAACIDPHTASSPGGTYQIQAIIDIDNSFSTTLGAGQSWSGLQVYVPANSIYGSEGQTSITSSDLVKRARFLAYLADWIAHKGNNGNDDDLFLRNVVIFANHAKSVNSVFTAFSSSGYTDTQGGWQSSGVDAAYLDKYNEAKAYAESIQGGVGGVTNSSTGDPDIEFTDTETILGPYRLTFTGDAKVTGITIETPTKTYTSDSGEITVLNKDKQEVSIDSIPNNEDIYLHVNGIADDIKNITLSTTGVDVYAARIMLLAGGSHQRLAVFNADHTEGNGELKLKVPPAKPILVAYKYIKSIQRLQSDGTYERLFTCEEIPELTVENVGKNSAKVTDVKYPDITKYLSEDDLDENGVPYVYDGDIVEYQWVIYNIGPAPSAPGATYELVDEPGYGLKLQEGKENGWTQDGNTYKKTITLKSSLKALRGSATPDYYQGEDTMIYFIVDIKDKYDNDKEDPNVYNNNALPIRVVWKLAGKVFLDNVAQKDGREDGILSDGDTMLEGIEVVLFDKDGNQKAQTTTDSEGYYEFDKLDVSLECYVRFKYNGQLYEPTTYQTENKFIVNEDGTVTKTGTTTVAERSYATDGKQNRQDFNNKFTPVDADHTYPSRDDINNEMFMIYAYTGPNGQEELLIYNAGKTKEERLNVNFGIKEREIFDMNLRKDLVDVNLTINGKSHTYNYPGGDQDLEVEIRGTDVRDYEREIRKSDLAYKANDDSATDKLQVVVKYKIQIKNQSVGKITGYILQLNDYADDSYELINSYDENNKTINWTSDGQVSGNGKTYNKMYTTDLAEEGITDKKWIFMEYKVSNDTLRDVLNNGETLEENLADIAGYKNTYTEDRYDLNDKKITDAGENAGLLDKDSTPANFDPVSSTVQNFITESKSEEYQSLGGEEKTSRSTKVFEDDADYAPGLKLIRKDDNRVMNGNVFEDTPLEEKLKNDERIGDGEKTDSDPNVVNQVKVELICTNEDVNNVSNDADYISTVGGTGNTVRTGTDGNYHIEGYIPGDYLMKFTYGDYECLIAPQNNDEMYTGQDYKSTIYTEENYSDSHWYGNTSPRNNDAKDDYDRRLEVNKYSENLQYSNAAVLNETKDQVIAAGEEDELAKNTWMSANTANMSLEVEYYTTNGNTNYTAEGTEDIPNYDVENIDFGIIERPRTKIVLQKQISYVKLIATDGSTIFDSTASAPNLTWKENKYNANHLLESQGFIQGSVDENILYGSTVNVKFSFKIINDSEKDYNEQSYYYTGVVGNPDTENKMLVNAIIDYLPNVLEYNEEFSSQNGSANISSSLASVGSISLVGNDIWEVVRDKANNMPLSEDEYKNKLLEEGSYNEANNLINVILQTDLSGINSNLKALNSSTGLKAGDEITLTDALTLRRVIARSEETTNVSSDSTIVDDGQENVAEILKIHIDNGRRPYYDDDVNKKETVEIPGNGYPITGTNTEEADTGKAERLVFMVPFGANKQLTIIIATVVGLAILIAGVVIIKKKVL